MNAPCNTSPLTPCAPRKLHSFTLLAGLAIASTLLVTGTSPARMVTFPSTTDAEFPIRPSTEYTLLIHLDRESFQPSDRLQGVLHITETNGDFNHELETVTVNIDEQSLGSFSFASDNGIITRTLAVSIPIGNGDLAKWFDRESVTVSVTTSPYVNQSYGLVDMPNAEDEQAGSFFTASLDVLAVPEPTSLATWACISLACFRYRRHGRREQD